jgi:lipopolysaccharide/colanic/teichoic acid biosynthesis glycosyltransferase
LRFSYAIKRAMDVVLSAAALIVLAIPLLVVALLIKLTSPGPVLFPLTWAGKDGKLFRGYKLRTMIVGAEKMEAELQAHNEMVGPAFKMDNDPRITSIGHVLRKHSIDELPQLWSVLKGDMSLVGPRPPRDHEYARFTPFQKGKMAVKPGLTCLWQVEGRHAINDYDDWVERDLDYIRRWSLWLDIKILARTVGVVVLGTGK